MYRKFAEETILFEAGTDDLEVAIAYIESRGGEHVGDLRFWFENGIPFDLR